MTGGADPELSLKYVLSHQDKIWRKMAKYSHLFNLGTRNSLTSFSILRRLEVLTILNITKVVNIKLVLKVVKTRKRTH